MKIEGNLRSRTPREIVQACEKAMSGVPRWKGGIVESRKAESNLEHVNSLHALAEEVRKGYPALAQYFDWNAIGDMIDVHDIGEIISTDLVRSRPGYLEVKTKHKRKERLGFIMLSRFHIKDESLRHDAQNIYRRYVDLDSNDTSALFTHLLDKIQAIRFGLANVYNDKILPMDRSLTQATMSVDLIFEFAKPLLEITQGEVKNQISAFVQVELEKYRQNGFPVLADDARGRIFLSSK